MKSYAIIEIKGKQLYITKGERIVIPRYQGEVGEIFKIENVLFLRDNENVLLTPEKIKHEVVCKILEHTRGPKIFVYHKKRRSHHREKSQGSRIDNTEILIMDILAKK